MKIIINPADGGKYIATVAIGEKYEDSFYKYALPSWANYCKKYNLGLILFNEQLISESHSSWKKPQWQKLLIGKKILESGILANTICYLDTDIIISPLASNIFDEHVSGSISVISQINNLPFPDFEVRKRVAFFRNKYLDNKYPLDSSLFASTKQIFDYHNLEPQTDYFCSGVFIFDIKSHADLMYKWFFKYPKGMNTITGGGEEPILNFEFQNSGLVKFINYKFQALWLYEMAWKYPFLYNDLKNYPLIKKCIQTTLLENHFLHFCGSWSESDMYYLDGIFSCDKDVEVAMQLDEYIRMPSTGSPVGQIKPNIQKLV